MPHMQSLYRVSLSMTQKKDLAEDLVQETYQQAWKSFRVYSPGTDCKAWLFRILFRLRNKQLRQARWWKPVDIEEVPERLLAVQPDFQKNVEGGETTMLHLDDWEHCEDLFNDPIGKQNFIWGSPKSKNVDYKVEHPVFFEDNEGKPQISYIDQFPEPKNMKQGIFLQRLSDALEESKNKIIIKLPVGSIIIANNYFWLHGRKSFKENKDLSRELLRIRGFFFKV